ncbi:MAG TPA: SDR family oxidoreductase [Pirellulaceae bacterium]|nr:SDR family oxidoreductase [Pirellulaceae bacterium]HMO92456.1 SDR family oxidoreductase [Pirellulaceae bacterium]HMP67874.1 SDR family oxidoreductase [Pirellulaceae bacterium]
MATSANETRPAVVVTGSSTGIGRAVALHLAAQGHPIVLHGRQFSSELVSTCRDVTKAGVESCVIPADFEEESAVVRFFQEAIRQFAGPRIWVNMAGANILTEGRADASFERDLEQLWKVDVRGTLLLSRLAAEHIRDAARSSNPPHTNWGSIITIGWDQALTGFAGESGLLFTTAKGGVMAMTASLAKTYAPYVRVNCVAPGWIRTEWGCQANAYWQHRATNESLMNRWGTPNDIAKAIGFLVSEDASFINGQVIALNGGFKNSIEQDNR